MDEATVNLLSLIADGGLTAFIFYAWYTERRDARTDRIYYRNLAYQLLRVILVVSIADEDKIQAVIGGLKPVDEPPQNI